MVMASLYINKNPKTEVGTSAWSISVIGLTMCLFGDFNTLSMKAVDYFKY